MLDALRFARYLLILQMSFLGLSLANAQVGREPTRRLITQPIDNSKRVTLAGNTRSEANATNDRGPVPASLPMRRMQLLLRLPREKEEELDKLLQEIQDPNSPNYHKWLTPEQFGQEFSLAPEDIRIITGWLRSQGFDIDLVDPRWIDFSGTAGQVRDAFHTEIHYIDVKGVRHIANMSDPQIPAALAPAVAGIVSLNDFKPHPMNGEP
jgi:subtilase family serine protease